MRIHFVNYADGRHAKNQKLLNAEAMAWGGFDSVFGYTREWLTTTDFYANNRPLLDRPEHAGYCAWKPHIILDAMGRSAEGDLVVYLDCGDTFVWSDTLRESIACAVGDGLGLCAHGSKHIEWTKRKCFDIMACHAVPYYETNQLEAGYVIVRNGRGQLSFIDWWQHWCSQEDVMIDEPDRTNELPGFREHRFDQSVLTNLQIRYGIPANQDMPSHIRTNIRHAEDCPA